MIRGKSTLAYKKEKKIQIIISQVEQGYTIISIQLYLSILHLHPSMQLIHNQPIYLYMYIYMHFFPFSFSIVTRVKHDRVESDLERKQGRIKSSIFIQSNGTDRITDLRIGFCINRKRYRISSPIKINNHRARVSAR